MQDSLKHFSTLPREFLQVGQPLLVDIYVNLPHNKSIILCRKTGDILTDEDFVFFEKVQPEHLMLHTSDMGKLIHMGFKALDANIKNGDLASPAVKKTAASALHHLAEGMTLAQSIESVTAMIQGLISQFKSTPSVKAYEETLKRTATLAIDPLAVHHMQVSSISVLMALSIGGFTMDDLSDLAAAGLIHDVGLKGVTKFLADSHILGIKRLSPSEKLVYMRHIGLTLETIKKEKVKITPGIERIIEHHHENWNGSGFKGQIENQIYMPARLMRIADDLVCHFGKGEQSSYVDALEQLTIDVGSYDPTMFDKLLKVART